MNFKNFSPYEDLARALLGTGQSTSVGAHDRLHLERVWKNALRIHTIEGGDLELIAAAVLLHDSDMTPKTSPDRNMSSVKAAAHAAEILTEMGWSKERIDAVRDAVRCHSFSANLVPSTLDGMILQDADRLDALGCIGIARCFYTAGVMRSQLYCEVDPGNHGREQDDKRFALDHFPKKLLTLSKTFLTATGRSLAQRRHQVLLSFYEDLLDEIG